MLRSETKRKNVNFVSLRSETKYFWKRNKTKIRCIYFALVGSEKFEAKRSEMKRKKINFFSRERAKRMRNGSRFASFRFEAKQFLKRNRRTLSTAHILRHKMTDPLHIYWDLRWQLRKITYLLHIYLGIRGPIYWTFSGIKCRFYCTYIQVWDGRPSVLILRHKVTDLPRIHSGIRWQIYFTYYQV